MQPLPPIKITISKDDQSSIRKALKALPERDKEIIGNATRDQDFETLTPEKQDFLKLIAYFSKIATRPSDRALIKKTFRIEDCDIAYLIEKIAPPDGILPLIKKYTVTMGEEIVAEVNPETVEQGDFFPELQDPAPTLTVPYDECIRHNDTATISISKAAQVITQIINREETPIKVDHLTRKKAPTTITVTLIDEAALPDAIQISKATPITYYDRVVEDAIGNLFDQGKTKITPEMVYRQMNGLDGKQTVSPIAAKKIDNHIQHLARTWVKIDYTNQWKTWLKDNPEKGTLKGHIITANNITLSFPDGTIKSGWLIKDPPKIYQYSRIVKQVASVPFAILNLGDDNLNNDKVNNTSEVEMAKHYLLTQIARIRGTKNKKIAYDTIFKTTGDLLPLEKSASGRNARSKRIDKIKKILFRFLKIGYIAGYTEYKKGRRLEGVEIKLPPKSKDNDD